MATYPNDNPKVSVFDKLGKRFRKQVSYKVDLSNSNVPHFKAKHCWEKPNNKPNKQNNIYGANESSISWPMIMLVVRWRPLAAQVITTAAKEVVRRSSMKSKQSD